MNTFAEIKNGVVVNIRQSADGTPTAISDGVVIDATRSKAVIGDRVNIKTFILTKDNEVVNTFIWHEKCDPLTPDGYILTDVTGADVIPRPGWLYDHVKNEAVAPTDPLLKVQTAPDIVSVAERKVYEEQIGKLIIENAQLKQQLLESGE